MSGYEFDKKCHRDNSRRYKRDIFSFVVCLPDVLRPPKKLCFTAQSIIQAAQRHQPLPECLAATYTVLNLNYRQVPELQRPLNVKNATVFC